MKTETYVFLARFRELREFPDSGETDDPGAAEPTLAVIEDLTAAEARMVAEGVERDAHEAPLFLGQPVHVWAETGFESAAHASQHRQRCRQAKEVEEALCDLPNEESQNDAVYFLASAVLRHANSLRWLRRRLTAPIRERLAYELDRDRIRQLHANLLRASDKYPNLCHFAVDVATAHSCLDGSRLHVAGQAGRRTRHFARRFEARRLDRRGGSCIWR